MAQLVERFVRIEQVSGSNPLSSTFKHQKATSFTGSGFFVFMPLLREFLFGLYHLPPRLLVAKKCEDAVDNCNRYTDVEKQRI